MSRNTCTHVWKLLGLPCHVSKPNRLPTKRNGLRFPPTRARTLALFVSHTECVSTAVLVNTSQKPGQKHARIDNSRTLVRFANSAGTFPCLMCRRERPTAPLSRAWFMVSHRFHHVFCSFVQYYCWTGGRMTVAKLSDGSLWVHSPVELDEPLRAALGELGPVAHIVSPNYEHVK